ncbi:plasmid partition protein ParG [[Erwinia] mediterraneensis]|uniref:plasmid partition protein ParG n=1 Tax=[Erwinia] mediterraneensis TaxID=2161819 RepID=UPI001030A623|nr:plasmid partition protein ParG [[Erwinia] mediterraneensis]
MALEKQHAGVKKMQFGENRDLDRVIPAQAATSGKTKRVNVNFDEEMHQRFKVACARKGISISDVIKELVDDWLKKND